MSEVEGPVYKDGDIVWVKLGSCWWPGEVTENGPEDFTAKKPPLAIVKFFNESSYEFVKTNNNIYPYNCDRKNEFIRKGMDSFRANNPHMSKFPGDVSLAEIRTDGNPNILSDPIFTPQKRSSIIAEVFGSPTPKKAIKEGKHRGRAPSKNTPKKPKINITHRRFLGCDDYEAHIRVQYPGKDTEHLSSDEEIVRLNTERTQDFNCSSCSFTTNRLEVMLFHVQCHIKGIATSSTKKRSPKKKKRTKVFKHITSDDDRTNSSTGFLDTDSDEEVKPKPKRKRKSTGGKKSKQKKTEEEKPTSDIRSNLLAEWSDSEDNDEADNSKLDTSGESFDKKIEQSDKEKKDEDQSKDNKSCFDFDDEEEDSGIVHTAVGRKIPRVIPPTDKRKSTDPENEASLPIAEDDANRMEILKVNETLNENSNSVSNDAEKEDEVFKDLMDSTLVPELPDVPSSAKSKNLSKNKSEHASNKKTENVTEVATKLTNPKKRFVKSFEDFELLQNEQRRAQEEKEELKKEKSVVVEPAEPNEPTPVVTPSSVLVLEQSSSSEKSKTPEIEENTKEEVESIQDKKSESKSGDDSLKKLDADLQISKLKCQIMSKLSDEELELAKNAKGKSHRSPRYKILESYRNDKSKEQKNVKSDDEKDESSVEEVKKGRHSPKKSKQVKAGKEEIESEKEETSAIVKEVDKSSDVDIGKIRQIDEYLDDFLFDFPKKSEPPQVLEEEIKSDKTEKEKDENSVNEVRIKCAGVEDKDDGGDISIKTNLTNFNKSDEEMSGLSTLAMVSQLETNSEKNDDKIIPTKLPFDEKPESELVPIDGNLTVVSEKDLADGQVEITASTSPIYKKPVTLTNFSMDFSECNSNSTNDSVTSDKEKPKEEIKKSIGEGTSLDIEDQIPPQIVDKNQQQIKEPSPAPSSKLLERLTEPKKDNSSPKTIKVPLTTKDSTKTIKTKVVKSSSSTTASPTKIVKTPSNKAIILSEKIIKPVKTTNDGNNSVSVQKITSKRNLQDPDEIDTFIIQKGTKSEEESSDFNSNDDSGEIPTKKLKKSTTGMDPKKLQVSSSATSVKKRGKAKILQQTIITPAGEIIQPTVATATTVAQDDNVFDINSMPIVLSDQILTPESIENMPIYLSDSVTETVTPVTTKVQTTIVKKTPVQQNQQMRVINKSVASPVPKLVKTPKIIGTVGSKIIKQNSFQSASSKHGKYVIVTQAGTTPTSKYTVGKKQTIIKRVASDVALSTAGTLTKVQNIAPEPSGNKIMILTDQQGQQQRVLLTPAQQKMMGYTSQGTKVAKTVVKGNIIQKTKDGQMIAVPGSSGLIPKSIASSRINSNQTLISSSGQVLTPIHPPQGKTVRIEKSITPARKIQIQSQKIPIKPPQQKTILFKNQQGQTVRKIQGTDDALLNKQVAEQIEAIKASGALQKQEVLNYRTAPKTAIRRSYAKKVESPKTIIQKPKETVVPPPLAPISPKKTEMEKQPTEAKQERALHQLVIQDAMGNQTTITEGQILALPSETVDGQPQSYMLVTLDESGNLTPLNNEALLSLDPNLGLGGDLGNLQIDQGNKEDQVAATTQSEVVETPKVEEPPLPPPPQPKEEDTKVSEENETAQVMQPLGETGQQLIVTGDPIAAQKFLESLTEGNTDLANILASAEGSSILIHADGQQILINTDSDNQMLLSVNTDNMNISENTEGGGNPMFANQPAKNQDILAAALADTDVFQQEQNSQQGKMSQLSPNSSLYPMNVGNVLETSLTLNSPIMTPLEVPSTNSKKISDENDILNQVPKNVDLPITITDPNISQTVSQQQVASMMVNELQNNLELQLPISDGTITASSSEMNSPSFVYSLPSLDSADIGQKPFNSSMPLLTEDTDDVSNEQKDEKSEASSAKSEEDKNQDDKTDTKITPDSSFLDESEGLCTLGGEMCSSLSEPPPDMFDLSAVLSSHQIKKSDGKEELQIMEDAESKSSESVNPDTETSTPTTLNEDSCEIPVQPEIVTSLKEDGGKIEEDDSKNCKFD